MRLKVICSISLTQMNCIAANLSAALQLHLISVFAMWKLSSVGIAILKSQKQKRC